MFHIQKNYLSVIRVDDIYLNPLRKHTGCVNIHLVVVWRMHIQPYSLRLDQDNIHGAVFIEFSVPGI